MYKKEFEFTNLLNAYDSIKKSKISTGIDRINRTTFDKSHKSILQLTSEKISNKTYLPSPYKEVLIIKNADSLPRKLSIPTIRDKVVMEVLKDILKRNYISTIKEETVGELVGAISKILKSKQYDSYIKLDIKGYYDNIRHRTLLKRVHDLVNDKFIVNLVGLFIKNITIADCYKREGRLKSNRKGVPQGISISNILGSIYLKPLDDRFYHLPEFEYFRYVDDILIFCKAGDLSIIYSEIVNLLKSSEFGLKTNSKKESGTIDQFDFLGYTFDRNGNVSIATKNLLKIQNSLEKIFSDYKSSHDRRIKGNVDLLLWKINFRITGCFRNNRRYGWVIFFSQNEDQIIMHKLDWLVKKLCKRFDLDLELLRGGQFIGKSFVKTYKEYVTKRDNTTYIPNIDNFTADNKKHILTKICHRKKDWVDSLSPYLLDIEFDRFIFHSIRDIEKDLNQMYT